MMTDKEAVEYCVNEFEQMHKTERNLGLTVYYVVVFATGALLFFEPHRTSFWGAALYFLVYTLIYVKFRYDTKKKWDGTIKSFREKCNK